MDPLLHASLTTQRLSEKIDGGNFIWPDAIAGGQAHFGLRFSSRRNGKDVLNPVEVVDAFAAVGNLDARPATGTVQLKLGDAAPDNGVNTTAELTVADLTAAGVLAAFTALSEVGAAQTYPIPEVSEEHGSIVVVFPGEADAVPISAVNNELSPCSIVRVINYEKGGEHVHAIRFIQSPAAFASTFETRVPPQPYFVRVTAGGEIDGDKRNEVQALVRPADFIGAFQIVRNHIRSGVLSRSDGPEQIDEAIERIADEDGEFTVTNSVAGEAWIEFAGSMEATGHDLLEIHIPRAPAGDVWLTLDFDHADFFGLLREKDEVDCPLHIRVLYRDSVNPDVIHKADWLPTITAKRGLHWEGLQAKANLDFLRKERATYVPNPDGTIITGNQHYVSTFPTSDDVGADSFVHTHNLDTRDGHHAMRLLVAPLKNLVEGIDYEIEWPATANDDEFTVNLLPGGVFADPVVNAGDSSLLNLNGGGTITALGALAVTYTTAGPNSAFVSNLLIEIPNVKTLPDVIAELFSRLAALESKVPDGEARVTTVSSGGLIQSTTLQPVQIAFPLSRRRRAAISPWPSRVADFGELADSAGKKLLRPRAGSLVPAVHDVEVENLSTAEGVDFPTVADLSGRVFENDTGYTLTVIGRGGRPTDYVRNGEFLACDGVCWYAVEKMGCADVVRPPDVAQPSGVESSAASSGGSSVASSGASSVASSSTPPASSSTPPSSVASTLTPSSQPSTPPSS